MNNQNARILLAEDDLNLGFLIADLLEAENYFVKLCKDGDSAIKAFLADRFDLCLLDVMMPVKDGFTVAAEIRKKNEKIPIIFLTSRAMKEDKLKGFRIGADDYITKPFDDEELIARVEAVLKRVPPVTDNQVADHYKIGKYIFYPHNQELVLDQSAQRLTERESELLKQLVFSLNKLVKREDLLLSVWGKNDYFLGRSLDVFITKLRKYLKEDPSISIENVHGVGFILKEEN